MSEILSPALLAEIREAIANGQIPEINGIVEEKVAEELSSIISSGSTDGLTFSGAGISVPINIPALTPEGDVGNGFYEID